MSTPEIRDAKELAMRHRKRGVAILWFEGLTYGTCSYGMTRKQCDAMKQVSERIHELIQDGSIDIPEALR